MPAVTIRNLSEATHRALEFRAVQQTGRNTEAEIGGIWNQLRARLNAFTWVAL